MQTMMRQAEQVQIQKSQVHSDDISDTKQIAATTMCRDVLSEIQASLTTACSHLESAMKKTTGAVGAISQAQQDPASKFERSLHNLSVVEKGANDIKQQLNTLLQDENLDKVSNDHETDSRSATAP